MFTQCLEHLGLYHGRMLNFIKGSFCIHGDDHVSTMLDPIWVMNYIYWFSFFNHPTCCELNLLDHWMIFKYIFELVKQVLYWIFLFLHFSGRLPYIYISSFECLSGFGITVILVFKSNLEVAFPFIFYGITWLVLVLVFLWSLAKNVASNSSDLELFIIRRILITTPISLLAIDVFGLFTLCCFNFVRSYASRNTSFYLDFLIYWNMKFWSKSSWFSEFTCFLF